MHIEAHKHVQAAPRKPPITNEVSPLTNSKLMTQICNLKRTKQHDYVSKYKGIVIRNHFYIMLAKY